MLLSVICGMEEGGQLYFSKISTVGNIEPLPGDNHSWCPHEGHCVIGMKFSLQPLYPESNKPAVWRSEGDQGRETRISRKKKTGQKEKHTSKLWMLRKCQENIDCCGGIQQDDKNWTVRSLESTIHSDHEVCGLQFPWQKNKVRPVPTVHTWLSTEVCEVLHQIISAMG